MPRFAVRPGRVAVTILIDPDLREALRCLSHHRGVPQGDIVSAALRGHLFRALTHLRPSTDWAEWLITWGKSQEGD